MTDYIQLGAAIQRRREEVGLTQDDLSDRAGIAYSTLSKIERGVVKNPSVFTISAVALALGCSIEELLREQEAIVATPNSNTFVYCDMNGVLVRFFQKAFAQIAHECDLSVDKIETAFWHYNDAANRGEMSLEKFNSVMAEQLGITKFDWHKSYLQNIEPITVMHECLREIVKTNKVGILSNTHKGLIAKMLTQGLIPDINYACIVDSSEVGAIKPEPKIFEIAEEMANVQGEQILFVDDSRANLIAAERFGWRVMWFDDYRPADSGARLKEALNQ
jgi:FMN phosphatase YigB (HAD superfamily)/DNA-binding XRE family transcriptional regulator